MPGAWRGCCARSTPARSRWSLSPTARRSGEAWASSRRRTSRSPPKGRSFRSPRSSSESSRRSSRLTSCARSARGQARDLFLTGDRFDAAGGASDRSRPPGRPRGGAGSGGRAEDRFAADLRPGGRGRSAKRLIEQVAGQTPEEAMPLTVRTIAERRASEEAREGLTAFLEKRPPAWAAKQDRALGSEPDQPRPAGASARCRSRGGRSRRRRTEGIGAERPRRQTRVGRSST